jgi:predicted outer membrane protein
MVSALASLALILAKPENARAAELPVPVPPNTGLTDRGEGTISAADRDFVTKVRLAGLWEIPAGEMAQEKSDNARITQIGRNIAAQHRVLDELTRNAANKLSIDLPDTPNSDQQKWLSEMRDAEGTDFDAIYIDRLRAAHGKIFPAIAAIRAGTRNDTVRKLAQQANQFVMTHMTLLESSGIVEYGSLPTVPPPAAAALSQPVASQSPLSRTGMPLILIGLVVGLATGVIATRRIVGNRRRAYQSRWDQRYGV